MSASPAADGQWYTLVRFRGAPEQLTGVSQAITAAAALRLAQQWEAAHPADTTVVFDPLNQPLRRPELEALAHAARQPASQGGGRPGAIPWPPLGLVLAERHRLAQRQRTALPESEDRGAARG